MKLPPNVIDEEELREKRFIFRDREEAGVRLARKLSILSKKVDLVYAIPRGGVPIGIEVAKTLATKLDLLICRKLVFPFNREAGFGAIDPEGGIYLNLELVEYFQLSNSIIEISKTDAIKELMRLNKLLRRGKKYNKLTGSVIIVDDGIASGYTMMSAVRFVKKKGAKEVIVASPTASLAAIRLLSTIADLIVILNVRSGPVYAVADAYVNWYDLRDSDVLEYLKKNRHLLLFKVNYYPRRGREESDYFYI
ncbi:MAG: phosphoribosyltransferase [Thermoprotei archaeon]|nr:MAG: phosphoribosyltransferase [Thermoprotei archaeon]